MSFIGQVMAAIANIFLFVSPGVLSDVWFPLSETALASGVCTGAFAVGNVLGYVWPSLGVHKPIFPGHLFQKLHQTFGVKYTKIYPLKFGSHWPG